MYAEIELRLGIKCTVGDVVGPGYMWVTRALRLEDTRKPAVEGKLREETIQEQGTWQALL